MSASKRKRNESTLWQHQFWEHQVRDDGDYETPMDYHYYNPVKHGLINPLNPLVDLTNFIFESKFKKDTDDIIDTFLFTSLPESTIMRGMDGKAALELVVKPTRLPLGMYEVDDAEYVNSFRYLNSSEFNDKTLQNIIEQAHKNEEYYEKTSLVASWVLPEIATIGLFSKGKIAQQFLTSFLASEVTYETLKNNEDN